VRKVTDQHRARQRCHAYPYRHGVLLGTLAAAVQARRILELGTALGYTALSFAHGAANSMVDTIERDPEHVELARENIAPRASITASPFMKATSQPCCRPSTPVTTSRSLTVTHRCRRCISRSASFCGPAAF
jgi:hypothetical protein